MKRLATAIIMTALICAGCSCSPTTETTEPTTTAAITTEAPTEATTAEPTTEAATTAAPTEATTQAPTEAATTEAPTEATTAPAETKSGKISKKQAIALVYQKMGNGYAAYCEGTIKHKGTKMYLINLKQRIDEEGGSSHYSQVGYCFVTTDGSHVYVGDYYDNKVEITSEI